jgi:tetratricopeptide (TPR) repeat protein
MPMLPYAAAAVGLVVLLILLWLVFGRGPRRRRVYRRTRHLLQQGAWRDAIVAVRELQALGPLSAQWEGRSRNAEGECLRAAGVAALGEKDYEKALEHHLAAAQLLGLNVAEVRNQIVGSMLQEVYRHFATAGVEEAQRLLARILIVQSPCPEASFWMGLCHVRSGKSDLAVAALRTAHEGAKTFVDPPLYLGVLQMRAGQMPEALRFLSEANRTESNCPFVAWQLGTALVAANGDAGLAVRALQKALGPRGLPLWVRTPEKAWVEGMPPAKSFVGHLAAQQRYVCPLLGGDVAVMVRQAFLSLSQAQYRAGNYQETANICANLLQDAAPTVPVLRLLGLSLARLGRFDEAFKHLKTAHEREEPKDAFTAGYLGLCGASGKPSRPEDKPSNVLWAIRLLARFDLPNNAEWAEITRKVYAEAWAVGLSLPVEDLARAADNLAASGAVDAHSAAVYDQLAAYPFALKPVHAFLYCGAAQHGFRGQNELTLFGLAFAERAALAEFAAARQWSVEDLEATYLALWAEKSPGRFPDVLGPNYPPSGERLLLTRSLQQETAGHTEAALHSAAVLLRLLPHHPPAFDRLACLHYRRGALDEAVSVLAEWQEWHASDPTPLIRRAVIEQQRGNGEASTAAIEKAMRLTHGQARAQVAFLGARLSLQQLAPARSASEGEANASLALRAGSALDGTGHLLTECLKEQANHAGALALLAALRWQIGDRSALVSQASAMSRPDVADARFHYFAAVGHLAAEDYPAALDAADRATADPKLAMEALYLIGRAQLQRGEMGAAVAALEKVARTPETPSAPHARAVLGHLHYRANNFEQARHWWQMLEAPGRTALQLDAALPATVLLAALQAFESGRFEQAAERLREAGRLGWRDKRLGALLQLMLFKAGQRLYYLAQGRNSGDLLDAERVSEAAHLLNSALQAGCKDPDASYLLAMAHKHRDRAADARTALRRIGEPDANVWLQLGLLSLRENQLAQAETEFARAWEMDRASFAAGANLLLCRLALGQTDAAATLASQAVGLATDAEAKRRFTLLQALLRSLPSLNGAAAADPVLAGMTLDDEYRLVQLLRALGHLDTVCLLLRLLTTARPGSAPVREASFEALLLKGKRLVDRCEWGTAFGLLKSLTKQRDAVPQNTVVALVNLIGCCACLCQDFPEGTLYFTSALRLAPDDGNVHQNLALAYEWQGNLVGAEPHWNRYFDLLERRLSPAPDSPDSLAPLLFEGLHRLSTLYSEKEKWTQALPYLERAHRLRPEDGDTLERLFTLYTQLRRHDDARRMLQRLKALKPDEGQYELYELDLVELRDVDDIDAWVTDVARVVQNHQGQPRVEERALTMIGNVVPLLTKSSDQLTEQLNKVMRQVRGLQNYQINWPAVHEVMRDLKRDFGKVRRTVSKCLAVVTHPEHRRVLRSLGEHVDRKIEFCREWQGN